MTTQIRGTRWTKHDQYVLLQGISIYGLRWFQRKTGRTLAAIYSKAHRICGQGGMSRGSFGLRQASRETGYHPTQIRRAREALRQKWKRTSPHGRYLIYDEQMDELIAWLKSGYWSDTHRLYGCGWCGTEKRDHRALGLCSRCYQRYAHRLYRAGLPLACRDLLVSIRTPGRVPPHVAKEAEKRLSRGRAMDENTLAKILRGRT